LTIYIAMKIIKTKDSFTICDFSIKKKYDYKNLTQNNSPKGRTYSVGEKKLPSVTTILSKTQSLEKQEGLQRWRNSIGHEEAARITNQAAVRGTEMHYVLENYFNGINYFSLKQKDIQPRRMAHVIVNNLHNLSEVWGSEVTLHYYNNGMGWAGSSDLIGLYDKKPTVIDFKQSNKPKKEEWIEDYYYQIAAYTIAHRKNYGDIEQGLICVCTKDYVYQPFIMSRDKIKIYEDKWYKRVEEFYKKSKTSSPSV